MSRPPDRAATGGSSAILWGVVFFVFFLDQATKIIASVRLPAEDTLPVLKGFFHLTLVRNTGAAFGILHSMPWLFAATSAAAAVVISVVLFFRIALTSFQERIALAFILGGTIGNLADRARFGYVVDFLDFRVWPVFNVADSFITVGAAMLAVCLIKNRK